MDVPIHERGGICLVCGKPNYGLQACKRHYHRVRAWLIKVALVNQLGGKCFRCKRKYPTAVFDFHHRDPKEKKFSVSNEVNNKGWKELIEEAKKCDLLCANCHRKEHIKEEPWQVLVKQLKLYLQMKVDMFGT
jgi:hypothetical protein